MTRRSAAGAPPSPRRANADGAGAPGRSAGARALRGTAPAEGSRRIAAIDIGSNSIRQIVADVSAAGAIRIVDEMKAAPRLGGGVHETGELSEPAMRAALEALSRMVTLARRLGASRVVAVATSAVREAANGHAFLDLVHEETGLRAKLLVGEEEARLSFLSALAHFDLGAGRAVVMDIGGGSLEFALSADGLLERLLSFPLGALRLTEEFLRPEPRRRRVRALRQRVRDTLRDEIDARDWYGAQVIGSGGTFTNLAGMHLARQGVLTARTLHGTVVPRTDLEHLLDALQDMSSAERQTLPGLNPARADIIVGGLAVAAEVLALFESREIVASAYGIREGLLLDTAHVTPAVADPGEARERSVRDLAERSHYEEPHARHVQRLALQLFDALGTRIGCAAEDRQTLADAALLHDVGYHINYSKHHKHSYHLILHASLLGVPPAEQVAIANVARYHRGALPKRKHRNFGPLDRSQRDRIERLAALLRLADGLDRGHVGAVRDVKVRWLERAIRIAPTPVPGAQSLRLELWGASRKRALLEKVVGLPVEIVGPDGEVVHGDEQDDGSE
ncbi:MAG TPA: Ppx/GppA phosphatase family protein [Gemmatimonadaceae bacterium]|nr:Ppx/GppA phosphatase family protein [Gemmatimonadaceae bacterium]